MTASFIKKKKKKKKERKQGNFTQLNTGDPQNDLYSIAA